MVSITATKARSIRGTIQDLGVESSTQETGLERKRRMQVVKVVKGTN